MDNNKYSNSGAVVGHNDVMLMVSLLILDLVAYYISLFCSMQLRLWLESFINLNFHFTFVDFVEYWWFPLIYIFLFAMGRLYTTREPLWSDIEVILRNVLIGTALMFATVSLLKLSSDISRLTFSFTAILFTMLIIFGRILIKQHFYKNKLAFVFDSKLNIDALNNYIAMYNREKYCGYITIGYYTNDKNYSKIENLEYLGDFDSYIKDIESGDYKFDTSAIVEEAFDRNIIYGITTRSQLLLNNTIIVPEARHLPMSTAYLSTIAFSDKYYYNFQNNLNSKINQFIKNAFDIFASLLILLIASPVMIMLALLVKFGSQGGIFYKQKRVGKGGRTIYALKFRTMYQNSDELLKQLLETDQEAKKEWEDTFKLKNDPRVTAIGRFLRKYSLDELPQLLSIIKGDMSLVGPRPITQIEADNYYKEFARFYYQVKPGLTGLWQVSGRNDVGYDQRVKLDTYYVLSWSLWNDIIILIKTPLVVIKGDGAY